MKEKKLVYKFYRNCFYKDMQRLFGGHRAELLQKYVKTRAKKIKLFARLFKKDTVLGTKHRYLCYSLIKCKLPAYLHIKGYKKTNTEKPSNKATVFCSRTRFCAYCWVRVMCKSFVRMVKKIPKKEDQVYAYKSRIELVDYATDTQSITKICKSMFSPRYRFSSKRLIKFGLLGVSETLCVYPVLVDGKKKLALEFRQLAYCNKKSDFALSSEVVSDKILGLPSVKFCSFPAGHISASVHTQVKIDNILSRIRLTRRYGIMYNPLLISKKVETSPLSSESEGKGKE